MHGRIVAALVTITLLAAGFCAGWSWRGQTAVLETLTATIKRERAVQRYYQLQADEMIAAAQRRIDTTKRR